MKFSILGHSSYIGRHLAAHLIKNGHQVDILPRNTNYQTLSNLDHVFYCLGLTADFRDKPLQTAEAHCCILRQVLQKDFTSLTYLSSTKVYKHAKKTNEQQILAVNPTISEDLYHISKLMGESMCLSLKNTNVRVVRLSNVYGKNFNSDNYLDSLIKQALEKETIQTHTSEESEKDYIYIKDVVEQLAKIALHGKKRIYNLASGQNIKSGAILDFLSRQFNVDINNSNQINFRFPIIDINSIKDEFNFVPQDFFQSLSKDIEEFKVL